MDRPAFDGIRASASLSFGVLVVFCWLPVDALAGKRHLPHGAIYWRISFAHRTSPSGLLTYSRYPIYLIPTMKDDPNAFLPLSPATLHVLLALTTGDMHGYAIMQDVLRQSEGLYKLGPGTLYDNLQKLVRQGMVKELGTKSGDEDSRRRYYRLTALGSGVLAAEISRLEGVVRDARLQMRTARPRRA